MRTSLLRSTNRHGRGRSVVCWVLSGFPQVQHGRPEMGSSGSRHGVCARLLFGPFPVVQTGSDPMDVERGRHEGATRAPQDCSGRRALQESRMNRSPFQHGVNRYFAAGFQVQLPSRIAHLWSHSDMAWCVLPVGQIHGLFLSNLLDVIPPCLAKMMRRSQGLQKALGTRCIRVPAPLLRVSQTASRASSSSKPWQPQDW